MQPETQPTSPVLAPKQPRTKKPLAKAIRGAIESKKHRQPFTDYRKFIQDHYDGMAGRLTRVSGFFSGHEALAGAVFKPRAFDLAGCRRILDAGCGDGRYTRHILRRADPEALIAAFDLSSRMLVRARRRLKNSRVCQVAADLTHLPYPDGFFDAVVCGWVLEHLPDPYPGLRELARVLQPGGKLLLMTTEDTLTGAMCSSLWHCRTYNRAELNRSCQECGLQWVRPLYFTQLHRLFRLGGIVAELRRTK
jgi:ubiquinone/menaquinone biosynthesis C-methylase UbiE